MIISYVLKNDSITDYRLHPCAKVDSATCVAMDRKIAIPSNKTAKEALELVGVYYE